MRMITHIVKVIIEHLTARLVALVRDRHRVTCNHKGKQNYHIYILQCYLTYLSPANRETYSIEMMKHVLLVRGIIQPRWRNTSANNYGLLEPGQLKLSLGISLESYPNLNILHVAHVVS